MPQQNQLLKLYVAPQAKKKTQMQQTIMISQLQQNRNCIKMVPEIQSFFSKFGSF